MTNLDPDPIDRTHHECLTARDQIRRHVATIRTQIAAWEPAPLPTDRNTRQNGNRK